MAPIGSKRYICTGNGDAQPMALALESGGMPREQASCCSIVAGPAPRRAQWIGGLLCAPFTRAHRHSAALYALAIWLAPLWLGEASWWRLVHQKGPMLRASRLGRGCNRISPLCQ